MQDENYYKIVSDEIRSGRLKENLWTEVYTQSGGDRKQAFTKYTSRRIEQLIAEDYRMKNSQAAVPLKSIHSVQFPKSRFKMIFAISVSLIGMIAILALQPDLEAAADEANKYLCKKAARLKVIGQEEQIIRRNFGDPASITSEFDEVKSISYLVYSYDPSSTLCLNKKRSMFKIIVNNRTGKIEGWIGFFGPNEAGRFLDDEE